MTNLLKTFLKEEDGQDIVESQFIACAHRRCCPLRPYDNGQKHH